MTVRGPNRPIVVRKKERIAGLWMNGPSKTFPSVPGFYAVLASRPFRAVAPDETLQKLGIGFSNLDFGKSADGEAADDGFRASLIRLQTGAFAVPGIGRRGRLSRPQPVQGKRRSAGQRADRPLHDASLPVPRRQAVKPEPEQPPGAQGRLRARGLYARLPLSPRLWAACRADGGERRAPRLLHLPAPDKLSREAACSLAGDRRRCGRSATPPVAATGRARRTPR